MSFIIFFIIIFALLGVPLFAIIAILTIVNHVFTPDAGGIKNVILEIASIANMPLLHSIPLFTFAGYLLAYSNASKRLVRFTKAALGWLPAGLAIVVIIACSIFTAFTGASGITIVALGGLLLPALLSDGYEEKYSLGLVTSSGSFGLLFPPSLPIIMYAVIASNANTKVNIDELFIAGFIPGILIVIALSLHAIIRARKFNINRPTFSLKEFFLAIKDFIWEIPLPVILFGGIYSGKLVISDAACLTVIYLLIVEVIIKKDIPLKDLIKVIKESMILVGAILVILSVSLAATNFLIYTQVPQKLFLIIEKFITNKWIFLFLLNIFLLIVGCIMDIYSAIVVVVPLIIPIAEAYNIDPLHLGVIFLANLQIGYLTPPIGMNLFISAIRFDKPILTLYRSSLNFIGILLVTLIIITYIPEFSIWFKEKPSIVGQWKNEDAKKIEILTFKAGGIFIKREGDDPFSLLTSQPVYGEYRVIKNIFKRDFLILKEVGKEEKKLSYEIYNQGQKLVLFDEKLRIYKNNIRFPIDEKKANLIARWEGEEGYIEFNFSGEALWKNRDSEKSYGYQVKGTKLILFDYDENNNIKNKVLFKYIIKDNSLVIFDKKNKFIYKFVKSYNEN